MPLWSVCMVTQAERCHSTRQTALWGRRTPCVWDAHWGNVSCGSERRLWNPMKCPPSIRLPYNGTGGFNFRSVNILSVWLWSLVFDEACSLRGSLLITADTTLKHTKSLWTQMFLYNTGLILQSNLCHKWRCNQFSLLLNTAFQPINLCVFIYSGFPKRGCERVLHEVCELMKN